jgi:hypothetical protein
MPKFTPGPWEIKRFDESQTVILAKVSDKNHPLICIVSTGEGCPNGEGNAVLISKTTEMFSLLRDILADYEAYIPTAIEIPNKIKNLLSEIEG